MATVSIVIPASNAAGTLNATIDSVISQTYRDWELIIFDDNSSDATEALVARRSKAEPRMRLVSGVARGAAAARNRAAYYASAPWLLFLDADDLIRDDHLALLFAATRRDPVPDLVYGTGARMTPDGRIGLPEPPPATDHFEHLAAYDPFYTHACLLRREVFHEFGGFDTAFRTCEDWDLWQRLARAGAVFSAVDECVAYYRMWPQSLSHNGDRVFDGARQVILRGHDRDDRVRNPVPSYLKGMPREQAGTALLHLAMWCAGLTIGSGKDPFPFLQNIELLPVKELNVDRASSMMQAAVPMGACLLQEDWGSLWPRFENTIRDAFGMLEGRCRIPELGSRCMELLEPRVRWWASQVSPRKSQETTWKMLAPEVGKVDFGDLLRLQPISTNWGWDRGRPIDRLYIEAFLQQHQADVRGRVLEAEDNAYTTCYGADRVAHSDVLHVNPSAPGATIIADLTAADHIESDLFDCIILTQTLQYIFDISSALRTLKRILKPGGVLLLSVPGIGQIDHDRWGDMRFWSMTPAGFRRLLAIDFQSDSIEVTSRGNVFSAVAFLQGLSQEDIAALDYHPDDPHYPVTILARVVKGGGDTPMDNYEIGSSVSSRSATAMSFLKNLRKPDVSSVMVVAAHPDDEVIGAGGHLGCWPGITVVHVTNGSPRDPSHAEQAGFPDRASYAAKRRQEAESALDLAGVSAGQLIALGFDDLNASFQMDEIAQRLRDTFEKLRPHVVVTHAYEGGHPDHDATCFAAHAACKLLERSGLPRPALVEMSSYFGRDGVRLTSSFLPADLPAVVARLEPPIQLLKKEMFACHSSQKNIVDTFPTNVECFRLAPDYDFSKAPHPGELFYEHHLGFHGARWRSLAELAAHNLGLTGPAIL
jgi:LmbE family N-acetylglucosaminyl deacetylase/SAM-dependent methyltransferase